MSAARAYEIVSAVAPLRVRTAICSRANDGLIRARARRLLWGNESTDNSEVPPKFWWGRGELALTQNWGSGDFETWIDQRIHCRAYGVEFFREDIEAMVPAPSPRTPLNRSEPGNYAPAHDCLSELRKTLGCDDFEAQRLIIRACRTGLLSARCETIWWSVKDRYGRREDNESGVAIPDWFWEHCLNGPDTVLNWMSGRFAGKGMIDGDEYKVRISGVQFNVGELVEIESMEVSSRRAPGLAAPLEPSLQAVSLGRPLSDRWRPWIAELVAEIHDHGVPEGVGSQGQEQIIKAVAEALAERGQETLSRSAVQPVVQAVLDRMRAAGK
jgi:hypothetical protein